MAACGPAVGQKDSRDTINSIGRKPKPVTRKAPARAAEPKPAVRRSAPRPQPSRAAVSRSIPKTVSKATPKPAASKAPPSAQIVVSALGRGQARTISEAIRAAAAHTRILVRPGIYSETLVLDKEVTIEPHPDQTGDPVIVEGVDAAAVVMRGAQATVRGLVLRTRSGKRYVASAVEVSGGKLTIENCSLRGGSAAVVTVRGGTAELTARQCAVKAEEGDGVAFEDGAQGLLQLCDVSGGKEAGVRSSRSAAPTIKECRIHDNEGCGALFEKGGRGTVDACEIYNHPKAGVGVFSEADATIREGKIYGGKGHGISFEGGKGLVEHVEIYGVGECGVYAAKATVTVRRADIHDIKRKADGGGGVAVYLTAASNVTMEDCDAYNLGSNGVWAVQGSTFAVRKCRIHDTGWDGVSLNDKSTVTVEDCDIYYTTAAGVGNNGSFVTVTRTKIHHSKNWGVYFLWGAKGSVEDCDIFDNTGVGIATNGAEKPVVKDCRLYGNKA